MTKKKKVKKATEVDLAYSRNYKCSQCNTEFNSCKVGKASCPACGNPGERI